MYFRADKSLSDFSCRSFGRNYALPQLTATLLFLSIEIVHPETAAHFYIIK
jgi:hypothetical protein